MTHADPDRPPVQPRPRARPPDGTELRILLTTDAIREPLTGVGRVAWTLARELTRSGHTVIALDHEPVAEVARVCTDRLVLPACGPATTARWHLGLLPRVQRHAPPHDVLLNVSGYPNARGRHPRLAVVVHDLHMFERGFYRPLKTTWFRLFYGAGLARAARLICPSRHTHDALVRRFPATRGRALVIPNAVPDRMPSRTRGEFPRLEEPYLLFVGTLELRKNLPRLLEAFAQARADGLRTRLVLAGRFGHGAGRIRRRIRRADLAPHVTVVERPDDATVDALYAGARALVFPSLEEGFGLPVLEAMQAGVPVLCSEHGAPAEVASGAALLAPATDTEALARALRRIATDEALRRDLVARGMTRVGDFAPAMQARAYAEALASLRRSAPTDA